MIIKICNIIDNVNIINSNNIDTAIVYFEIDIIDTNNTFNIIE